MSTPNTLTTTNENELAATDELAEEVTSTESWQVASCRNQTKSKAKSKKKSVMDVAAESVVRIVDAFNGENVDLVKGFVERKEKILVILRGCPGSGKSTLAR